MVEKARSRFDRCIDGRGVACAGSLGPGQPDPTPEVLCPGGPGARCRGDFGALQRKERAQHPRPRPRLSGFSQQRRGCTRWNSRPRSSGATNWIVSSQALNYSSEPASSRTWSCACPAMVPPRSGHRVSGRAAGCNIVGTQPRRCAAFRVPQRRSHPPGQLLVSLEPGL